MQLHAVMTINDSQLLAGHTSSISTMTVNSSIDIRLPVDKFINNGGASVARVKSNKEKEQETRLKIQGTSGAKFNRRVY